MDRRGSIGDPNSSMCALPIYLSEFYEVVFSELLYSSVDRGRDVSCPCIESQATTQWSDVELTVCKQALEKRRRTPEGRG
jgi:hypothetical protein